MTYEDQYPYLFADWRKAKIVAHNRFEQQMDEYHRYRDRYENDLYPVWFALDGSEHASFTRRYRLSALGAATLAVAVLLTVIFAGTTYGQSAVAFNLLLTAVGIFVFVLLVQVAGRAKRKADGIAPPEQPVRPLLPYVGPPPETPQERSQRLTREARDRASREWQRRAAYQQMLDRQRRR